MIRSVHHMCYDELALLAAREAGRGDEGLTIEQIAADEGLRGVRDGLWEEFERMCRDTRTYTIDELNAWLTERGCAVSRSSVHRARVDLLARERQITLCAAKARAVLDLAGERGETDTLRGGRVLAGQLLFRALGELPTMALEDMTTSQVLTMIDTLSRLSKAHAETDLINQRLAEARERFDREMKAALTRKKGTLTDEDLVQARELIFGKTG